MPARIAPNEGFQTHFVAIMYLNKLSMNWKLRKAGEPHELTPALIGEWRQHRGDVAACTRHIPTWSYVGDRRVKIPMKHNDHALAIQFINDLILNLEAEYGWPAPLQPLVNEHDIEQLRRDIRHLEQCRTFPVKY